MADFFEIDFLDVESDKSGDAIAIRYEIGGRTLIHVVDGGFQDTGESLAAHIRKFYGAPRRIDHVVATHPDGDHAGGLRTILEEFEVGALWMLRPWLYAGEIDPTVNARERAFSWQSKLNGWGSCTTAGCAGEAAGCFVANVMDAEILWAPCFATTCTATIVGCAVYQFFQ